MAVSDGSLFKTESFFHSSDNAAIKHIYEDERIIAVEGPLGWTRTGDTESLGANFHKNFALGHQFHAFLLHFEETVSNVRQSERIHFGGGIYQALSGDYPYGGVVHLVLGDEENRPEGLLFEFPDTAAIRVTFHDWRTENGVALPFRIEIDDGERIFDYRYNDIDITPKSPLWFFETISAPQLDEVQIYRVHRKMLAAHCLDDAGLIAALSASELTMANRGELFQTSSDAMLERFTAVFERVDYTAYHDIKTPIIETSPESDLGWIWVNVRAVGSDRASGEQFNSQWAWVMLLRKIEGEWLSVGNASNMAE